MSVVDEAEWARGVDRLKEALAMGTSSPEFVDIVSARDEVLRRFGPVFSAAHVQSLREEELRAFLDFKNNRHWTGLHRQGPRICADMEVLRAALGVLLERGQPVAHRVDQAVAQVSGMGKAIVTAILHVAFPDEYGVWNTTSEGGLKLVGLWPHFERGRSLGARYEVVNGVLLRLARALEIDLWTLDALLWVPMPDDDRPGPVARGAEGLLPAVPIPADGVPDEIIEAHRFGLEAHLQQFLWQNWDHTELGVEWARYTEPGDPERGFEYPCDVGRIDILAKHRTQPRWLVVELKRGRTSDQTVGQILRYMGWIRHELAEDGEQIEGLVIAHDGDAKLRYALDMVPNVSLKRYEVEFRLVAAAGVDR